MRIGHWTSRPYFPKKTCGFLSLSSMATFTFYREYQVYVCTGQKSSKEGKIDIVSVQQLLDGLKSHVIPRLVDPEGKGTHRLLISTPLAESAVAGFLTELAAKVEPKGVKVGSYPRWGKSRNTVTLVGR